MTLAGIAALAVNRVMGRLVRRTLAWVFVMMAALIAIYQVTVAGMVALELQFGVVRAHLIIGVCYALAALVVVAVLWFTARRAALVYDRRTARPPISPELQIAAILEAMLLGYAMSRRE